MILPVAEVLVLGMLAPATGTAPSVRRGDAHGDPQAEFALMGAHPGIGSVMPERPDWLSAAVPLMRVAPRLAISLPV